MSRRAARVLEGQGSLTFDAPRPHVVVNVMPPPPPVRAVASPLPIMWPPLQKVSKVQGADGKVRPTVVTQLSGEGFRAVAEELTQRPPWPMPVPSPYAWDGGTFRWPEVTNQDVLLELVARGALVVSSDSGGKDSQTQGILLGRLVPPQQLLFIHASLPGAEWDLTVEQARGHAAAAGAPFMVVEAERGFLKQVRDRFAKRPEVPSWPDSMNRWCTKGLKSGPIEKAILGYAKEHGFKIIVDAAGLRAKESAKRARQPPWRLEETKSQLAGLLRGKAVGARRLWLKYLPIQSLSRAQVWATIAAAGQMPHPAYVEGNERLSCVFCVLGSKGDLRRGAIFNPEMYEEYLKVQDEVGWKFRANQSLQDLVGLSVEEARAQRRSLPVLTGKRFTPDMIPAGRPEAGEETEVGPACGTDDEWSPEDDGDAEDVKENGWAGMVCRRHAHLVRPRRGR